MKQLNEPEAQQELVALCETIREFIKQKEYRKSESLIAEAMGKYPHAPEPHNLLGLLLEAKDDHLTAMKHFRAAWVLNPTYIPAQHNLNYFGSFYPSGNWAFDESDCPPEKKDNNYVIEYDAHGIGHVVRKY